MNYDSSSERVAAALRAHLEKAEAGARLPSTRSLAETLGVGPVTVQRAVSGLVAAGLIETRPGSGNFAARRRIDPASDYSWQTTSLGPARAGQHPIGSTMISPGTGAIALHSGYPADDLLPTSLVRTALGRAARSAPALHRPPVAGLPELREWFAAEVNAATGAVSRSVTGARAGARAAARASDVLITPGGQSALASIFRALAGPGESIVMESPTYWGAIAAARQAGLIIVPIARGASAPAAADLEAALEASGARLFYAQPNFANPTGAQWSTSDAAELLGVVRARGAFLIEDDWAHEFGIDGDSIPLVASDDDGHVVYVRSLTKSVAPGLRVAAVIAKGPALRRIETDRTVDDLYVSGVLQAAALDVVTQPGWRGHVRTLRGQLGERRDTLLSAVASHAPSLQPTSVPRGGLNLWLRLPEGVDPDALAAKALTRGVVVSPGTEWYPAEPPAPHLRLNFAGPNPERFAEAAQILGELLD